MTPQEMIDVIQAYADGKEIERRSTGNARPKDWTPITTPAWNFASNDYRVKPPAAMWQYYFMNVNCTTQSEYDKNCKCWWDEGTGPCSEAEYGHYNIGLTWRPANLPVTLRPHYPALIRSPMLSHSVTSVLFASEDDARHIIGFVRLATEYPPVMLP